MARLWNVAVCSVLIGVWCLWSVLEVVYAIELEGEFFRALVALFPEHGEPRS